MGTYFTKKLIQAISDWQQGGNSGEKRQRGLVLQSACRRLPKKYRQCGMVVFRRLALTKKPLWRLLVDKNLSERISAWTLTTDVAKTFKYGVPPQGWQGLILHHVPDATSVIVNLPVLFASPQFQAAVARHQNKIRGFHLGMGRYMGSQSEVVIKRAFVTPDEIYALGGYSSKPKELGELLFGENVTSSQITWMRKQLQQQSRDFGKWWIEGAAKERVLAQVKAAAPILAAKKKRRSVSRRAAKSQNNK